MVTWRYEISQHVLKNNSFVCCAHSGNIFCTLEEKFCISAQPCIILYIFILFQPNWVFTSARCEMLLPYPLIKNYCDFSYGMHVPLGSMSDDLIHISLKHSILYTHVQESKSQD